MQVPVIVHSQKAVHVLWCRIERLRSRHPFRRDYGIHNNWRCLSILARSFFLSRIERKWDRFFFFVSLGNESIIYVCNCDDSRANLERFFSLQIKGSEKRGTVRPNRRDRDIDHACTARGNKTHNKDLCAGWTAPTYTCTHTYAHTHTQNIDLLLEDFFVPFHSFLVVINHAVRSV